MSIVDKIDKYLNEASVPKNAVEFPTLMYYYLVGFAMDKNGNSIVKIFNDKNGKTFSIQTNGNLKATHNNRFLKPKEITAKEIKGLR